MHHVDARITRQMTRLLLIYIDVLEQQMSCEHPVQQTINQSLEISIQGRETSGNSSTAS
jgi:hypothetical protein